MCAVALNAKRGQHMLGAAVPTTIIAVVFRWYEMAL